MRYSLLAFVPPIEEAVRIRFSRWTSQPRNKDIEAANEPYHYYMSYYELFQVRFRR